MKQQFREQHGIEIVGESTRLEQRLYERCETAKIELSERLCTSILNMNSADARNLKVDLSKIKFEELIMPELERCIKLIEMTLEDAGLEKDEIAEVLLVGGSTRIPKLREMIIQCFGGRDVLVQDGKIDVD